MTPLLIAAKFLPAARLCMRICLQLVEARANIDFKGTDQCTALQVLRGRHEQAQREDGGTDADGSTSASITTPFLQRPPSQAASQWDPDTSPAAWEQAAKFMARLREWTERQEGNNVRMAPILWAAQKGDKDMFKLLAEAQADVRAQDHDGKTALHYAVQGDEPDICKTLITGKARVDMQDYAGQTPLHLGAIHNKPKAITWLLGNCRLGMDQNDAVEFVRKLFLIPDHSGNNALHYAAEGSLEACESLVQFARRQQLDKTVVSFPNSTSMTPLHILCTNSRLRYVSCCSFLQLISLPRIKIRRRRCT